MSKSITDREDEQSNIADCEQYHDKYAYASISVVCCLRAILLLLSHMVALFSVLRNVHTAFCHGFANSAGVREFSLCSFAGILGFVFF